jgi:DNA invertase Pin-like site-specific DNA recombinase
MRKLEPGEPPPLDRWRFDEEVIPAAIKPREKIWGANGIAAVLGVSVATIYRWTADPECDVPIRRLNERYFALRSELISWMQGSARNS